LQKIKVRIGTTKLGRGGHTIGIKKIIAHDSEDLALLLTEDEIESGNRIGLSYRAERLGEIGTFFGNTYFIIYRKSSNRSPCPIIDPPD